MSFLKRFNPVALIGLVVAVALLALLASLPNAFAQSKAVLKTYTCPAEQIEATADQIRAAFKNVPDLRVAADRRTGQILVNAPAEVQAQIAARMAQIGAQTVPAAQTPVVPAAPVAPQAPAEDASALTATNIPLQNINARDFEAKLHDILKNRLTALPNLMPGANRYQLMAARQDGVELAINHSANQVTLRGPAQGVLGASRLVRALDTSARAPSDNIRLIAYQAAKPENMKKAVDAVRLAENSRGNGTPLVAKLYAGQNDDLEPRTNATVAADSRPAELDRPAAKDEEGNPKTDREKDGENTGLSGSVQVEMLEGLDVIVIRGKKKDIEQVASIIEQIEKLSTQTEPSIEIYPLANVNCEAMATLIRELYIEVYYARQGSVSITPLIKPNALLLVGRKENVLTAIELTKKLDTPVSPDAEFRVFPLRHATATSVQDTVNGFYANRASSGLGLSTRVFATADVRSNAVVVQAGPRDMVEIAALIARLDTATSPVVNEVQIVKLENTMADELVQIIQGAFNVKGIIPQTTTQGGMFGQMQQQQQPNAAATPDQRSAILRFLTIDAKGKRRLESGILNDVRITADLRANSVVVSAPAESMELLVTLIHELDRLPLAEAQIKVFTIVNGDATQLMNMLQTLFSTGTQQRSNAGGGFNAFGGGFGTNSQNQQGVVLEGGETLIPVRLAPDTRTNSIIASGDKSNLDIIEAILLRLDGSDVRNRKNHVYKLKNSPASTVSQAINQFLTNVRQMQQQTPGTISPFAQIEQEVIVVPETVSNSLIVSATPRFFDDIKKIVEELDARPPMVMIQVLIAEVTLNDNEEFGVELGLQDGLLFDRSSAITSSTTGATNVPGFAFNNQALGNNPNAANTSAVGTQGLSSFGLSRSNSNLGFGGFSFSASSESVSVLIRALKENDRLEVLSRPQVMTLDNQLAYVTVGQLVPQITGSDIGTGGNQVNKTQNLNVGLTLQVTPRISPDNLVVMAIDASKSQVNNAVPGIPITAINGQIITSPIIDQTAAQTTVSAMDGQTVVLGGLITKSKSEFHRKVPWLGDVPYLGRLFRYDGVTNQRKELLIIMTPHVVRNEADADAVRRVEAARMNWCLTDVVKLTGDDSLRNRSGEWSDKETNVVYPDLDPRAANRPLPQTPEPIPMPEGNPSGTTAPLPPEPSMTPAANGTSMSPIRPANPVPSRLPPAVQQTDYRTPVNSPNVQPATYERPAAVNSDPRYDRGATPVYYDAPVSYPATQTPVYR